MPIPVVVVVPAVDEHAVIEHAIDERAVADIVASPREARKRSMSVA
ncbi:MAG: hypothetical protein IT473_00175 [Lysobacter sp.]|nr:hypothetical protein [Lysobacter sp.]